jgi:hypothetical protein
LAHVLGARYSRYADDMCCRAAQVDPAKAVRLQALLARIDWGR